jgi:hypothetical protein
VAGSLAGQKVLAEGVLIFGTHHLEPDGGGEIADELGSEPINPPTSLPITDAKPGDERAK